MNNRPTTPLSTPTRRSIDGISRQARPPVRSPRQPATGQPPAARPAQQPVSAASAPPSPPEPPARPQPQTSTEPVRILKPGHSFSGVTTPRSTPVQTPPTPQRPMLQPTAAGRENTAPSPSVTTMDSFAKKTSSDPAGNVTKKPKTPKRKLLNMLSYVGIAVMAIAVGFALFDAATGQWIVLAGGIVALMLRVDSRLLFGAALFCLVMIPVMTIAQREALSENYAIYTFILLVIGTIRAMIESAANHKSTTPNPSQQL